MRNQLSAIFVAAALTLSGCASSPETQSATTRDTAIGAGIGASQRDSQRVAPFGARSSLVSHRRDRSTLEPRESGQTRSRSRIGARRGYADGSTPPRVAAVLRWGCRS